MSKAMVIKEGIKGIGFAFKRKSPEILIGVGIASLITAGVLACRSTLKSGDILDETKEKLDNIKEAKEIADKALESGQLEEQTAEEYKAYLNVGSKKELAGVYGKTALKFVKLYAPSILLTAVGITSILCGHKIMRGRTAAIAAAYTALDRSYNEYRKRVKEKYGDDVDNELKHGIHTETIEKEVVDDKGKTKKVKEKVDVVDSPSCYARFFDESSRWWTKSPESNLLFLKGVQDEMNWLLETRKNGIVFLNEVYKKLDLPLTQAGQFVGWKRRDGEIHQIDFGLYDDENNERVRDFVNGYERSILLDFNVDGVIWTALNEDDPLNAPGSGNF